MVFVLGAAVFAVGVLFGASIMLTAFKSKTVPGHTPN